jgi:hypothetical protein
LNAKKEVPWAEFSTSAILLSGFDDFPPFHQCLDPPDEDALDATAIQMKGHPAKLPNHQAIDAKASFEGQYSRRILFLSIWHFCGVGSKNFAFRRSARNSQFGILKPTTDRVLRCE